MTLAGLPAGMMCSRAGQEGQLFLVHRGRGLGTRSCCRRGHRHASDAGEPALQHRGTAISVPVRVAEAIADSPRATPRSRRNGTGYPVPRTCTLSGNSKTTSPGCSLAATMAEASRRLSGRAVGLPDRLLRPGEQGARCRHDQRAEPGAAQPRSRLEATAASLINPTSPRACRGWPARAGRTRRIARSRPA